MAYGLSTILRPLCPSSGGEATMTSWIPWLELFMASLRSACYFEWVQSKDNWSDGISRQGEQDPWFQRHGFRLFHTYPLLMLLQLPYHLIAKVFQFV